MSSNNKSMHTSLNHKLVWKYRSIGNPYVRPSIVVTNILDTDENPITDVPDALPIVAPYNDEIYLSNRILAFERDGWKCTKCGSRENLQAHHVEPVPKGVVDSDTIHRLENLRTLCETCHHRLPRRP